MEFKIDAASLLKCVDDVLRLASPATGNLTVTAKDKALTIASNGFNATASVAVPATPSKSAQFSVQATALRAAIDRKGEVSLTLADAMLTIRASRYSVAIPTFEVIEQSPFVLENSKKVKVSAEQSVWLTTAIRAVESKTNHTKLDWIPTGIKLTAKGAFVTCYEMTKMSWAVSKDITGDVDLVLPTDTLGAIMSVFGKDKFIIETTLGAVSIRNARMTYAASVPTTEGVIPLEVVYEKHKELAKTKLNSIVLLKDEVLQFMQNAKAVIQKTRGELVIKGDGKKATLSVTTQEGTAKATIKAVADKEFNFTVDLELFAASASKAPGEWSLGLKSPLLVSEEVGVTTMIGLNA